MERRVMSKKISVIKKIKEEHNLPNDYILDLVARSNGNVSDSTLRRILADGSEDDSFRYSSIADLYNALTMEFGEDFATDDPAALKIILSERNKWIDRLAEEIETLKEDYAVRETLYSERKQNYEKTIELQNTTYEQSLALLRERIAKQDIIIEKLLDAHLIKD